ncbi:4'-phosphopantetheinyl transferase superfamily protein [Belliella sp. R4-6]|uniref:4'-phosphopantetheinyl transferase superfamily protein n=1 Tax=Belliella alkalica TaxID=1730871 RepID=A0ABS9V6J9_9BACT|nr:4'-phosphopantetheinyl transferase superfamily protein [Belliella alkalica]MCH7412051.1 4'-phosphopantetheinyl transferase superfamily protein [Belliella alkalica]
MFIGTDIEHVSRIQRLLDHKPRIIQKIFFDSECKYSDLRMITSESLTGIWCAKEAVLKAFAPVLTLELKQIEITKNPKGFPEAIIHHPIASSLSFHLSISISHTKDIATATALLHMLK